MILVIYRIYTFHMFPAIGGQAQHIESTRLRRKYIDSLVFKSLRSTQWHGTIGIPNLQPIIWKSLIHYERNVLIYSTDDLKHYSIHDRLYLQDGLPKPALKFALEVRDLKRP